jgi:hypothetical protein
MPRSGEVEIIPPSRPAQPARPTPAPVTLPARVSPGDLFLRPLVRFDADSRALTFTSLAAATYAEADATQADAELTRSLSERAIARAEYNELPERLAQERHVRRLRRAQEIRAVEHEIVLAEIDHQVRVTRGSADLMQAMTDLTLARANCTAARHRLLETTQAYLSQAQYGDRYYDLMWERKVGEETLHVEEQRAVLQEHRQQRLSDRTHARFHEERVDLHPDGMDATSVDAEISKVRRRVWR